MRCFVNHPLDLWHLHKLKEGQRWAFHRHGPLDFGVEGIEAGTVKIKDRDRPELDPEFRAAEPFIGVPVLLALGLLSRCQSCNRPIVMRTLNFDCKLEIRMP